MRFILVVFITCSLLSTKAQRTCGTSDYKKYLLKSDTGFKKAAENVERQIELTLASQSNTNTASRDTSSNEIIYIPVVVHVLYKNASENISDAQIKSQIDVLNKDFRRMNGDRVNTPQAFAAVAADTRIQFCLAQVDPKGLRTNGIDRRQTSKDFFTTDDGMKFPETGGVAPWNPKQYLNIWICRLNSRSLGYTTPPGASADREGVVMNFDVFGTIEKVRPVFNKGRTATHEVGHWLGLTHIWGDETCGNDHVDDTPTQKSYNFGCPIFPKMSTCSPNTNGDMFMNYMDFSDDVCMNTFTIGQARRMRALFAQNNIRNSFLASFACDSTMAQGGPLPSDTIPAPLPVITLKTTKIYPNPVQSIMTVSCKAATSLSPKQLQVQNLLGVILYSGRIITETSTHNIANLPAGMYVIVIKDLNEKFATKIVKL